MKNTFKKVFAVLSATAMLGVALPAGALTAVAETEYNSYRGHIVGSRC